MKLALLGYGKMGKAIEKVALNRGHEVIYKTNKDIDLDLLKQADLAIDFSVPDAAFKNISEALKIQLPVISGTTGWLNRYDEAVKLCHKHESKFLYASNFSVGVNLFFKLNAYLSKLMVNTDYNAKLEETHHIHKKDAPSGTAITLAEQVIEDHTKYSEWSCPPEHEAFKLPIEAYREGEVFGDHTVTFFNKIDQLSIRHTAFSRDGFSKGAVIAAEWIYKQPTGVYTMAQVLDDLTQ
ncbi:4-hydroxy-tetrahydrodipicolinate reductase [Psychroflexus sp. ALD_RP9]|uniref:4-hydroxy-tetrahydrodipicolinate reductase n=1 Tax=Psychroflexus sp. ALD_RP9 TaxID=2777186 RepID=UPI001A906FC8|nr:4-hydroxy-tetrahydrodipicolinate reductase [Psychroflexus sp. ALD_RP9]QSS97476.1 4-hydroxy-tetrahydrodipicolinate reductase [Psychroflexus sp. ALD_RP9]